MRCCLRGVGSALPKHLGAHQRCAHPTHAVHSHACRAHPPRAPTAGYFSQFGKLTRVRLSRNKKTGHAKHYAFLEFQHADVARIVVGFGGACMSQLGALRWKAWIVSAEDRQKA